MLGVIAEHYGIFVAFFWRPKQRQVYAPDIERWKGGTRLHTSKYLVCREKKMVLYYSHVDALVSKSVSAPMSKCNSMKASYRNIIVHGYIPAITIIGLRRIFESTRCEYPLMSQTVGHYCWTLEKPFLQSSPIPPPSSEKQKTLQSFTTVIQNKVQQGGSEIL